MAARGGECQHSPLLLPRTVEAIEVSNKCAEEPVSLSYDQEFRLLLGTDQRKSWNKTDNELGL